MLRNPSHISLLITCYAGAPVLPIQATWPREYLVPANLKPLCQLQHYVQRLDDFYFTLRCCDVLLNGSVVFAVCHVQQRYCPDHSCILRAAPGSKPGDRQHGSATIHELLITPLISKLQLALWPLGSPSEPLFSRLLLSELAILTMWPASHEAGRPFPSVDNGLWPVAGASAQRQR